MPLPRPDRSHALLDSLRDGDVRVSEFDFGTHVLGQDINQGAKFHRLEQVLIDPRCPRETTILLLAPATQG